MAARAIRKRIGVFLPPAGQVDHDYWEFLPRNAVVVLARSRDPGPGTSIDRFVEMAVSSDIEETVARLLPARPDVIAYACSSVSFIRGTEGNRGLVERMERAAGLPATTATRAIDCALRALDAHKVGLITPYPANRNRILEKTMEEHGTRVVGVASWDSTDVTDWLSVGYDLLIDLAVSLPIDRVEAVVIPCTSLATARIVAPLERALGRPVVTANQALIWHSLRLVGSPARVRHRGRLFELEVS